MRLTPPTSTTFMLSLLLAILALAMHFVPQVAAVIPLPNFYVFVIAYAILLTGTLVKGV